MNVVEPVNLNSAVIQHDNQVQDREPYKGDEMEQGLAIREESAALMPVMSIETATERYKTIVEYVSRLMKEGSDFGKIPGTERATLLKPGAEKLCTLFGLSKRFEIVKDAEDWESGFFYYLYRCALYRGDHLIAEGDGSCSSRESKYRWRNAQRVCPQCNQATIFQSKNQGDGFYCWMKKGGCGAKFFEDDDRITAQQTGKVANPDIADQVNTIQKMAQKRALIAATLLAVNASEFFTQDYEDFVDVGAETQERNATPPTETKQPQKRASKKDVNDARRVLVGGVAQAFKALNQAGYVPQWTKGTANDFVSVHFQGAASVDDLEDDQLNDLLRMLSEKLDTLKTSDVEKRKNLVTSITSYFDTEQHLANYLKDHGGKKLEEMTNEELEVIESDVSVPF